MGITYVNNALDTITEENKLYDFDTKQTYLFIHITTENKQFNNLKSHYTAYVGLTKIDWGDGTSQNVVNDDSLKHLYASEGNYMITMYGMTAIGSMGFRAIDSLYKVYVGSTVTSIGPSTFTETGAGTAVYFFSEDPPTVTNNNAFRSIGGGLFVPDYVSYYNKWYNMMVTNNSTWTYYVAFVQNFMRPMSYSELEERPLNGTLYTHLTVTVGTGGQFSRLTDALRYVSQFYPIYKYRREQYAITGDNISVIIRILSGTTISEQVFVEKLDLQYVTITAEDSYVPVDATNFNGTMDAHDARGDYPFIAGEYAAKLPTIGCLFRLTTMPSDTNHGCAGLICNRGSEGVVLPNCGFEYFTDGVIANNESSITIREGISRHMTRWGVHARHNGEVSARSADVSYCGIGAAADRVADVDVREATFTGCTQCIVCDHVSRICANASGEGDASSCGSGNSFLVTSSNGSVVDTGGMNFTNSASSIFNVSVGGTIIGKSVTTTGIASGKSVYSQSVNTLTANGIIYA